MVEHRLGSAGADAENVDPVILGVFEHIGERFGRSRGPAAELSYESRCRVGMPRDEDTLPPFANERREHSELAWVVDLEGDRPHHSQWLHRISGPPEVGAIDSLERDVGEKAREVVRPRLAERRKLRVSFAAGPFGVADGHYIKFVSGR